jgi:hypothetical protein
MIREDRPSFQLPAEIRGDLEQTPMQYNQSCFAPEVVLTQTGAGCDKIGSAKAEPMFWRMWPWNPVGRHEM